MFRTRTTSVHRRVTNMVMGSRGYDGGDCPILASVNTKLVKNIEIIHLLTHAAACDLAIVLVEERP